MRPFGALGLSGLAIVLILPFCVHRSSSQCSVDEDFSVKYNDAQPAFVVSQSNFSCICPAGFAGGGANLSGPLIADGSKLFNLAAQAEFLNLTAQVASLRAQLASGGGGGGPLPGPPTAVAAVNYDFYAVVSWTAPASAPGGVTNYEVTATPAPVLGMSSQLTGSNATTYRFANLQPGTTYSFAVKTVTSAGMSVYAYATVSNGPVYESCKERLAADPAAPSGLYTITGNTTTPFRVWCDMELDGGGYTVFFSGKQGQAHVFGHFENIVSYCPDPANQCMRRLPPNVDTTYSIVATCRDFAIKFYLNSALINYWKNGQQNSNLWTSIPGTVSAVKGTLNVASSMTVWTGGPSNNGWIIASSTGGGNQYQFTSSYNGPSVANGYDGCNGVLTGGNPSRLMYRSFVPSFANCAEIKANNASAPSGYYSIDPDGAAGANVPYVTYCDMEIDGGGWTVFYAQRSGYANVVDHFESAVPLCQDAGTSCIRRLPSNADSTWAFIATCGSAAVKMFLPPLALSYFINGQQSSWVSLYPLTMVSGTPGVPLTGQYFWSGSSGAANTGWIVSSSQSVTTSGNTFASAYNINGNWDGCNGQITTGNMTRWLYKPNQYVGPPLSCKHILAQNASSTSGSYTIDDDGPGPRAAYQVYCDMSSDGGGWTSFFNNKHGSPNVFDYFEAASPSCPDPINRCIRRLPPTATTSWWFAGACGTAMVKFQITAAALAYWQSGTQAAWQANSNMVNIANSNAAYAAQLWTGQSGNNGWILISSTSNGPGLVSNYNLNSGWDSCNGVTTTSTSAPMARLFYRAP